MNGKDSTRNQKIHSNNRNPQVGSLTPNQKQRGELPV